MNTAFFGDIRMRIADKLYEAQESDQIAMAWFTNEVLFKVVLNLAAAGKKVELIISDSHSNFQHDSCLDFGALCRKNAKVFVARSNSGSNFMHHKFAIIDQQQVITGSYNWSNNAQTNFENVVLMKDAQVSGVYATQFEWLVGQPCIVPFEVFIAHPKVAPIIEVEADDSAMFRLARIFNEAVASAMHEADSLRLGLRMDIIRNMINRYTAVGAARKLSNDPEQSGFLKLVAENRADLTFEYLTARSEFAPLFDKATIKSAKEKLRPYLREAVDKL